MSFHSRSVRLFGASPWLPLRRHVSRLQDGEDIEFTTKDHISLKGTYFKHKASCRKGVILYCHELNGSRWSVTPYVDSLLQSGFDLFAFDMRNHGESEKVSHLTSTPWVTVNDLADVQAAINFLFDREGSARDEKLKIGLFGLSKGATVAACMAGLDARVDAVVLDSPAPEGRLFEKSCWTTLTKASRHWKTVFTLRYIGLCLKAVLYSVACPFYMFLTAWWRTILGYWFGCRFISTRPLVRFARQPIFIIHGNNDDFCRIDQIHAFCHRMPRRPNLWVVSNSAHGEAVEEAGDEYHKKVTDFFEKSFSEAHPSHQHCHISKFRLPATLRNFLQL